MAVTTDFLVPRHEVLGFYGVPKTGSGAGDVDFRRMQRFTELSLSKNPEEYTRKYVDEASQRSDVVAYAPSISYAFDRHRGNDVLTDIIKITDREYTAANAVRPLVWVDTNSGFAAKRDYSVIPDTEGDDGSTYTYSGSFKATGDPVFGTATSTDNWMTITFTEEE